MACGKGGERLWHGVVDAGRVLVGEAVAGEVDGEHPVAVEVEAGHERVEGGGVVQPAVHGQDRNVAGAPKPT